MNWCLRIRGNKCEGAGEFENRKSPKIKFFLFCYNRLMNYRVMASTVFGLEAVLANELRDLGYTIVRKQDGRVYFDADEEGIAKANICLRTAERIYIVIGEFEISDSESLFRQIKSLPFYEYLSRDAAFPVDVNLVKTAEGLSSKSYTQKTIKKAVVESLRHYYRTEYFEEIGPTYHIYVSIIKNRASVMLDTSGSGLNRRGYREYAVVAPLRETLAAALVLLSGWRTDTKLIDAFCGSGTILIEAALWALGIPPNKNRHFAFEKWKRFCDVDMTALRNITTRIPQENLKIEGYDIDPVAIRQARINASKAGVSSHIHFQVRDVEELKTSVKKGTLISNLPYGERLLDQKRASELNQKIGRIMRGSEADVAEGDADFRGWYKCFLTSHEDFESEYGEKASKNRKLYNGGLKSYLYFYNAEKHGFVDKNGRGKSDQSTEMTEMEKTP